jgi:aspartate aminotransferase
MKIADYVTRVEPSPTMAITAKAKAMIRDGVDVIPMSAGEPDFDTPQHIKDAAITAIQDGFTKYTSPPSGIIELKEAICEAFRRDNGLEYGPDEVIVNVGAKHSIFLGLAALLDPGDEVIVPTPYWVTFTEQPKLVGAISVVVETRTENGLKMTPEEFRRAITPKTRMLILNSPSNPSGAVYSRPELEGLAAVAIDHGIVIIADEIYQKLVYDGVEHVSIASLSDEMKRQCIVVNGLSKTYAMTGWRVGFAGASREVIAAMDKVQSQTVSHTTSMSQKAAVAALTGPQESVETMRLEYDQRRKYVVRRLNDMEGIDCPMPQGAFYVYPDVSAHFGSKSPDGLSIESPAALCDYLLETGRVACVPGEGFGTKQHLRISYATSMEAIETALDRIEEALSGLIR